MKLKELKDPPIIVIKKIPNKNYKIYQANDIYIPYL